MNRCSPILVLVLLALLLSPDLAHARSDLQAVRAALKRSAEPKDRIAQIPRLVASGEPGAAVLLGWLVETDPTLAVRIGAAGGLGRVRTDNATGILIEQLRRGGPHLLRKTLAESLARQGNGPRALVRAADASRTPRPERLLLVAAMAAFVDDSTRERLTHYAWDSDPAFRDAALRALAAREEDGAACTAFFVRLLGETKDAPSLRRLLDVLEPALHRAMLPVLERLKGHEDPIVGARAGDLIASLPRREKAGRIRLVPDGPKDPDDRYARPEPPFKPTLDLPPPPPPEGRREDHVYVFDATGSAMHLVRYATSRIRREIETLEAHGTSVRVGLVLYRGGHGRAGHRAGIEELPLTYDLGQVRDFLSAVDTHGTDDRGAAVTEGLRQALDLMDWRWNARRRVHLIADSGCDDVETTRRRVKTHYAADGTRTGITYVLRTRSRIPEEYDALAKAGGTGRPHAVD